MTAEQHASLPGPPEFGGPGPSADLAEPLALLLAGRTLTAEQTSTAFEAMMTGQVHHGEMGAMLALMASRTPTSDEILGAARVMRAHAEMVKSSCDPSELVDTAGTGGAPKTFNVSTAAAIIAAAAGARVAKHGNRSRTGRGSAEVLARLGVNIDADRIAQARCLDLARVCFCFAIHHHPATRHVMPVRRALRFPTLFNLLGPLTNPAGAKRQVMGVYDARFLRPVADALAELGAMRAMVVHSEDGLDELSISAPTRIMHVQEGRVYEEVITPESAGLERAPRDVVTAGNLEHAAHMIRAVVSANERGAARHMALLNAGATLVVAGLAESIREGVKLAARATDTGKAAETLHTLARLSQCTQSIADEPK